jgi:hypothetical protein
VPFVKYEKNHVEEDEIGGDCSTNGENGAVHRLLVGEPEGKRSLEIPRRRWADIKMGLGETGWGDVWIRLAHDRDRLRARVIAVMNFRIRKMPDNY